MKCKGFLISFLLGIGLLVGCSSEVNEKYAVVCETIAALTEFDFDAVKTDNDYFNIFKDKIKGLVTDELYQEMLEVGAPMHAIRTVIDHEASIKIESIKIEPEWAEEEKVGYSLTLNAVLDNEEKSPYQHHYRMNIEKVDGRWVVYAFKFVK